uniref:Uncharacterized protein n=1 Tax=Arundo donax TaxID=35708 RepID=A0A0A9AAI3_ARUDO
MQHILKKDSISWWDGIHHITFNILNRAISRLDATNHVGEVQHGALDMRESLGNSPRCTTGPTTNVNQRAYAIKHLAAFGYDEI